MIWLKIAPYAAGLVVAFGAWKLIEDRGVTKGKEQVVQASKKAGTDANKKAERARAAAAAPGAAERLLKNRDTCRDCE